MIIIPKKGVKHRKPYTYDELKITIPRITNNLYELVDKNGKDITIRHLSSVCDNNVFITTPFRFINKNQRCPICSHIQRIKSKTKTNEWFLKKVFKFVGNEYTFLENYKGTHIKIMVRHNSSNCNYYEYPVTPTKFLNGKRCPKCAGKEITTEDYKERIINLTNGEFEFIDTYRTAKTYSKFKHNKCNYTFFTTPNNFEINKSCHYCSATPGEQSVMNYLNKYNINFRKEYHIEDCKNSRPLRFDFAILDVNEDIIFLIEYDGEFHFNPSYEGKLEYQLENDNIKNDYCINNNIPLLRIPYWEFNNIDEILKYNFKEMNLC
jgi:Zn finger protein HypA/HybF involved in hydrogenase expression